MLILQSHKIHDHIQFDEVFLDCFKCHMETLFSFLDSKPIVTAFELVKFGLNDKKIHRHALTFLILICMESLNKIWPKQR